MSAPAIEINRLGVVAGRSTILQVDSLTIHAGELVALMGPNGAGKSTFLRVCLGMQPAVRGQVSILGNNLTKLSSMAITRLRRSIGYVPQSLPSRSEMPLTVREVVSIGRVGRAGLFRSLRKSDWAVVDEWMERFGISSLSGRTFHEISGGEQRKVVIARAMVQQPQLLLLDEPTANLDLGWRERIVETVQSLYEQTGLTALLVCHELEVIPPACRRVVLLNEGQIIASGAPENVFTTSQVEALYGPGLSAMHQAGRHAVIPTGGLHD